MLTLLKSSYSYITFLKNIRPTSGQIFPFFQITKEKANKNNKNLNVQ